MGSVFVPCLVYSLNNDGHRGHYMQRARIEKQIRKDAKVAALAALQAGELRHFLEMPVQILVEPHECRQKLTDVGNCMASAKAAIDGIRDAGVLVDDNPRYVKALTFLVGKRVAAQYQGLRFTFREWA